MPLSTLSAPPAPPRRHPLPFPVEPILQAILQQEKLTWAHLPRCLHEVELQWHYAPLGYDEAPAHARSA